MFYKMGQEIETVIPYARILPCRNSVFSVQNVQKSNVFFNVVSHVPFVARQL